MRDFTEITEIAVFAINRKGLARMSTYWKAR